MMKHSNGVITHVESGIPVVKDGKYHPDLEHFFPHLKNNIDFPSGSLTPVELQRTDRIKDRAESVIHKLFSGKPDPFKHETVPFGSKFKTTIFDSDNNPMIDIVHKTPKISHLASSYEYNGESSYAPEAPMYGETTITPGEKYKQAMIQVSNSNIPAPNASTIMGVATKLLEHSKKQYTFVGSEHRTGSNKVYQTTIPDAGKNLDEYITKAIKPKNGYVEITRHSPNMATFSSHGEEHTILSFPNKIAHYTTGYNGKLMHMIESNDSD
jgi:hypothetical protein